MMVEIERERLNDEKKTAELTQAYLEQQVESHRLKNDLIRIQIEKEKAELNKAKPNASRFVFLPQSAMTLKNIQK